MHHIIRRCIQVTSASWALAGACALSKRQGVQGGAQEATMTIHMRPLKICGKKHNVCSIGLGACAPAMETRSEKHENDSLGHDLYYIGGAGVA